MVAGGLIGKRGDVVVDSISNPTRIIGIANVMGGMIKDVEELKKYLESIKKVKLGIAERLLS